MLRQPWTTAATLPARRTHSNSPQNTVLTSRNLLAGAAQIARRRFPPRPHSIPGSSLPWTNSDSEPESCNVVLRRHGLVLLTVLVSSWGVAAAGSRDGCLAPAPKPLVGARGCRWKRGRFSARLAPFCLQQVARPAVPRPVPGVTPPGCGTRLWHSALAVALGVRLRVQGSYKSTTGPRPYIQRPGPLNVNVLN